MKVPLHIGQMSQAALEDWVCHTPYHESTELERFLVSDYKGPQEVEELESQIEKLEEELDEAQGDLHSAQDEIEDLKIDTQRAEENATSFELQLDAINIAFPDDMIEFCKEASMWRTSNARWKKQLTERSSDMIKLENERNKTEQENRDLKLQLKMYDSAGIEKFDGQT
jgi:chromosome segregation ATPase